MEMWGTREKFNINVAYRGVKGATQWITIMAGQSINILLTRALCNWGGMVQTKAWEQPQIMGDGA